MEEPLSKELRDWGGEHDRCSQCGGEIEISTDIGTPSGIAMEDDPVRCKSCGHVGIIVIDYGAQSDISDNTAYVVWEEDLDEENRPKKSSCPICQGVTVAQDVETGTGSREWYCDKCVHWWAVEDDSAKQESADG